MIKKVKSIVLTIAAMSMAAAPIAALSSVSLVSAATPVQGDTIQNDLCAGTNLEITDQGDATCSSDTSSTDNLNNLLIKIVNIFSAVVGVIAVIMIIVGGLRYITSGGDSNKVGGAKTSIIYALIGLVVVALSQLIVHFVLAQSAGVLNGQ